MPASFGVPMRFVGHLISQQVQTKNANVLPFSSLVFRPLVFGSGNNYLTIAAKGSFSNGKLATDCIAPDLVIKETATILGFKFIKQIQHFDVGELIVKISQNSSFLYELYSMGCRRIVETGLPPIGCLPIQTTAKFTDPLDHRCLGDRNADAQSYNYKLQKLLPQIQKILPGSLFVYAEIYDSLFLIDMIK
ncbi:GDSL esterase/lipase At2g31550-like [Tripterygium wilfordii]|uniref:GDSL esterase/lipase At2g31550-like n=1 Tax=Tripterygium wilfordii TaxID=458696 RepID=UPI0018F82D12|nr:GDSL esterase/lipase At2g31550-like [Tripterygium wilfordii]